MPGNTLRVPDIRARMWHLPLKMGGKDAIHEICLLWGVCQKSWCKNKFAATNTVAFWWLCCRQSISRFGLVLCWNQTKPKAKGFAVKADPLEYLVNWQLSNGDSAGSPLPQRPMRSRRFHRFGTELRFGTRLHCAGTGAAAAVSCANVFSPSATGRPGGERACCARKVPAFLKRSVI